MEKLIRHGDVVLYEVLDIPAGAKKIESKVLVEGEATWHAHRIDVGELFRTENGELYLKANALTKLSHEEHETVPLTKIYRITQKRQYTPNGWEKVVD